MSNQIELLLGWRGKRVKVPHVVFVALVASPILYNYINAESPRGEETSIKFQDRLSGSSGTSPSAHPSFAVPSKLLADSVRLPLREKLSATHDIPLSFTQPESFAWAIENSGQNEFDTSALEGKGCEITVRFQMDGYLPGNCDLSPRPYELSGDSEPDEINI